MLFENMHRVQIANKGICICSFQRASSGRTYLGWVTPSVTGEGSGDRGVTTGDAL